MLVVRKIAGAALFSALCVAGCSTSTDDQEACDACKDDYSFCSFPNVQESLSFSIQTRDGKGCSGELQGASVRVTCAPLEVCFESSGICHPAKYSEGFLWFGGGKCG